MEINVEDYLTRDDIKALCIDYVKDILRGDVHQKERVLSNMAYASAFAILDSALTPEMMITIKAKTLQLIAEPSSYCLFRKKDVWGENDSPAYVELVKAVEEHKVLINPLVKKAIEERDYTKDLPDTADAVGYVLIDALVKGLTK